MKLRELIQSIKDHNSLVLNEDDTEKLDLYIAGLERIIRILDKEDKRWI